jgi:hypothetical protein
VLWLITHSHHHRILHRMWCNRAIRPPQSSMSLSRDSRSSKKKHFCHHEVLCP